MIWNYRVFRDEDGILSVREVGYDDTGTPDVVCDYAPGPYADTVEELIEYYADAFGAPVLAECGEEIVEESPCQS